MKQTRSVDVLVLSAVATLPFTQAMTVNVGFPLKPYELLIAAATALTVARPGRVFVGRHLKQASLCGAALLAASLGGLAVTLTDPWRPRAPALYRFGPAFDALLQLGYLAFALVTMLLVAEVVRRRQQDVVAWWVRGAVVAAAYGIAVNLQSMAGLDPLLLPSSSAQVANIGSVTIYRAGTFLEGNFFGLYLLASIVLALSTRRRAVAGILTLALLLSLSTLAIFGAALVWLVVSLRDLRTGRSALAAGLAVLPLLVLVLLLPRDYYYGLILEKVNSPTSQSSLERRGLAIAALNMAQDRPVTGVGLAQYGLWFPDYRPSFVPADFLPPGRRYIANNVYAQVAAEQGVLGLLPFATLLTVLLRAALRARSAVLTTGLLAVLLCLNAFPSLTVAFLWAFFGVVLGVAGQRASTRERLQTGHPRPVPSELTVA